MKYIVELPINLFGVSITVYLYRVYNYKKNKYKSGIDKDKAHEYTTEQNALKAAQTLNGGIKIV